MKRQWPDEFNFIFETAEEVVLEVPVAGEGQAGRTTRRRALKVRLTQQDYERIWPLAETRFRLDGALAGKAVTLIANNPHYHRWHPADGGKDVEAPAGDLSHPAHYVCVHFLLDDVMEPAAA